MTDETYEKSFHLKYIPKHCCWQSFFMLDLMWWASTTATSFAQIRKVFEENCITRNALKHTNTATMCANRNIRKICDTPQHKVNRLQRQTNVETRNWKREREKKREWAIFHSLIELFCIHHNTLVVVWKAHNCATNAKRNNRFESLEKPCLASKCCYSSH